MRLRSCRQRVGDRERCGEGAEVGGAGGVVGGADAEVEVDGEEEVQLQRVELRKGEAADLGPAMRCRVKPCLMKGDDFHSRRSKITIVS